MYRWNTERLQHFVCGGIPRSTGHGYNKVVTYILDTENGSSLKAAGYTCEGRAGGLEWNGAKAPKQADQYPRQMKTRWVKKKEGLHGS